MRPTPDSHPRLNQLQNQLHHLHHWGRRLAFHILPPSPHPLAGLRCPTRWPNYSSTPHSSPRWPSSSGLSPKASS